MVRIRSASFTFLAVMAFVVTGCTVPDPSRPQETAPTVIPAATLALNDIQAASGEAARWASNTTVGDSPHPRGVAGVAACLMEMCPEPKVECTPSNCERREITLDVPEGWWKDHDGFLDLTVRWPTVFSDWFQATLEDSAGATVATARAGYMSPVGLVARLERPASGTYTAVVIHVSGGAGYEAAVQLESRPLDPAVRELLPNLVTLPPTDLTFQDPPVEGPGYLTFIPGEAVAAAHQAMGSQGCATEEAAAQAARRCLRFSNAVGNLGEGPLEIRLPVDQGAASAAGGHFVQRVYRSDGSSYERSGGGAEFHAMHAHWHNAAANRYAVFHHDEGTQERGDLLREGRKAGVCFADIGIVDLGLNDTYPGRFSGAPCLNPALSNDWFMGLSPNWYDNYYWILVDQYVEMTGAEDGAYELCSTTNQDQTLLEAFYDDNEACTVFRIQGDQVEVLSQEPYHHTPASV